MLCQLVFQPVIRLIQVVVAAIQYILIQICRLIEEVVRVVTEVLKYNPNAAGNVDQNLPTYILSDRGRPLVPMVDRATSAVAYFEVAIRGDVTTGELRRRGRELVPGRPFLYMPHKVMEIASHLFGDIFAGDPPTTGAEPHRRRTSSRTRRPCKQCSRHAGRWRGTTTTCGQTSTRTPRR